MKYGKAKRPLRLPRKVPACFNSQRQWDQYCADARFTATDGFTYCYDCTPGRQCEMILAGRCEHPTVTFVKLGDIVVGLRQKGQSKCPKK